MSDWDRIAPYDYPLLLSQLRALEAEKPLKISTLGELDNGSQLYFLETLPKSAISPRILVAAGFHGEEAGGVWGIIHFLRRTSSSKLERIHLSFIPVANPTGFSKGWRQNIWGESPNSGSCHQNQGESVPSREGIILIKNTELLVHSVQIGFLSLHEDIEQFGYYLYTFEKTPSPGSFTHQLNSTLSRYFSPVQDGLYDGASVKGGLAYRHCDGSFEDYLFHNGVVRTACSETPATAKLSVRVEANAALIDTLVTFALAEI